MRRAMHRRRPLLRQLRIPARRAAARHPAAGNRHFAAAHSRPTGKTGDATGFRTDASHANRWHRHCGCRGNLDKIVYQREIVTDYGGVGRILSVTITYPSSAKSKGDPLTETVPPTLKDQR